jgi:3-oxoacyl-[acyl-carrier-protein] synthase III
MTDNKVYIGGFSYELGEHVFGVEELEEIREDKEVIEKLHEVGLRNYRTTSKPVLEIAEMAIRKFFGLNIIAPADIDAVIFCTNSFWCDQEFSEYPLTDFFQRLGLSYAYPIASSFSYCGNFLTGARTACNYIKANEFKNILLVVADRTANGITRIVPPLLSIGSDAASCCLLTSGKLFDLEISGISQSMDAKMGKLDAGKDFIAYTQGVAKGVVGNIKQSLLKSGVEKNDLTRVISNNYNRWVTPGMVRVAGIPVEKISLENIPRFAHAGASDICINMADHLATSGNAKNEEILLLSTGPVMWGSAIVRNTSDQ